MYQVSIIAQPTTYYNSTHMLSIPELHRMRDDVQNNFHSIAHELSYLRGELRVNVTINKQLIQLLNWIAVTNPRILDEFQATSHAFDKLVPADTGGEVTAGPQA
jgi:hypothetical protein